MAYQKKPYYRTWVKGQHREMARLDSNKEQGFRRASEYMNKGKVRESRREYEELEFPVDGFASTLPFSIMVEGKETPTTLIQLLQAPLRYDRLVLLQGRVGWFKGLRSKDGKIVVVIKTPKQAPQ